MKRTVCLQCGKELKKRQETYCSRSCAWLVTRQRAWTEKGRESRKRRRKRRQEIKEEIIRINLKGGFIHPI